MLCLIPLDTNLASLLGARKRNRPIRNSCKLYISIRVFISVIFAHARRVVQTRGLGGDALLVLSTSSNFYEVNCRTAKGRRPRLAGLYVQRSALDRSRMFLELPEACCIIGYPYGCPARKVRGPMHTAALSRCCVSWQQAYKLTCTRYNC